MIGILAEWPKKLGNYWKTKAEILNCSKNYLDNLAEKLCNSEVNQKARWVILTSVTKIDYFVTTFTKS